MENVTHLSVRGVELCDFKGLLALKPIFLWWGGGGKVSSHYSAG